MGSKKARYCLLLIFLCFSCDTSDYEPEGEVFDYYISGFHDLSSNGHVSEGGLARLGENNVVAIYRKDSSFSHVSNYGKIVGKISPDNGVSWGSEFDIYDSMFDDRNLVVGTLGSGEIIVVFRRFDAENSTTIDSGFIKSSNGAEWSDYNEIQNTQNIPNQPFGMVNSDSGQHSFLVAFRNGTVRKYFSKDNFSNHLDDSLIIQEPSMELQEPFQINLGNGRSIILCRNGSGEEEAPSFFQFSSSDGLNYSFDGNTNLFADFEYSVRCPVSMAYDPISDMLEVVGNTRYLYNTSKNHDNELRVYRQTATMVFENAQNYVHVQTQNRPLPSNHWFYGYPKSLDLDLNNRLYMVTDAKIHQMDGTSHLQNEDANLYLFQIRKIKEN
ncbi:sialidase family protein [Flagellimonas sp.]|uniref:sialidase family protein n=1 Tax=Flagellimonas sp. TaxID=2058762 RepID=UPI003B51B086